MPVDLKPGQTLYKYYAKLDDEYFYIDQVIVSKDGNDYIATSISGEESYIPSNSFGNAFFNVTGDDYISIYLTELDADKAREIMTAKIESSIGITTTQIERYNRRISDLSEEKRKLEHLLDVVEVCDEFTQSPIEKTDQEQE